MKIERIATIRGKLKKGYYDSFEAVKAEADDVLRVPQEIPHARETQLWWLRMDESRESNHSSVSDQSL